MKRISWNRPYIWIFSGCLAVAGLCYLVRVHYAREQAIAYLRSAGAEFSYLVHHDYYGTSDPREVWYQLLPDQVVMSLEQKFGFELGKADNLWLPPEVEPQALAKLKHLPYLRALCLSETDIGDNELNHIARLTNLIDLNLSGTNITDSGLSKLKALRELVILDLTKTKISSLGLQHITHMPLRALHLSETNVDDQVASALGTLSVDTLGLERTLVTDIGMKQVVKNTDLVHINLGYTSVGDNGLQQIVKLPNLELLEMESTLVTDAGIRANAQRLSKIKSVHITGPNITESGTAILNSARQPH